MVFLYLALGKVLNPLRFLCILLDMLVAEREKPRILAVDDDRDALFALEKVLSLNGYQVQKASSGKEALSYLCSNSFDLVLLDVMMPGINGLEVVREIKSDPVLRFIPVLMLTANDSSADLLKGFEAGADDYIFKPFRPDELLARMRAAMRVRSLYQELEEATLANLSLREKVEERFSFGSIIGKSPLMREVYSLIRRIKDASVPVLILGESGTGKELVASALHYNSTRKEKPFVMQNSSALNDNLLESELFGHVKGAFSGAIRDKEGLFQTADQGTLFLDELGEMSPVLQAKLLRVAQDGSYTPVGSTVSRRVDVRILAATHRNLRQMVNEGSFREDLFYRLNVVTIEIPPLRKRSEDIPLLIEHFLSMYSKNSGLGKSLTDNALKLLCDYHWPGNVRELKNEIERLSVLSGKAAVISHSLISNHIRDQQRGSSVASDSFDLKSSVLELERGMIERALKLTKGNKSKAAKMLGISRSNLISKLKV
jgi:DNA-binding NtrC family response regulator